MITRITRKTTTTKKYNSKPNWNKTEQEEQYDAAAATTSTEAINLSNISYIFGK